MLPRMPMGARIAEFTERHAGVLMLWAIVTIVVLFFAIVMRMLLTPPKITPVDFVVYTSG